MGSGALTLYERWRVRREAKRFERVLGHLPDLQRPRTYNEKVLWRKVFDRNPLFAVIQDKLAARDYVRDVLGTASAESVLPRLLYVTEDPRAIPWEALPERCVIKATHGCGWNLFPGHPGLGTTNRVAMTRRCGRWLRETYGRRALEWSYGKVRPRILVEEFLEHPDHDFPPDYKFYVFDGVVRLVNVHFGRHVDYRLSYYDRSFRRLDVVTAGIPGGPPVPRPRSYDQLLELAESLGRGLDHVRVDLYEVRGRPVFGEFTVYPTSGKCPFLPRSFDYELGAWWKVGGTWREGGPATATGMLAAGPVGCWTAQGVVESD